MNKQAIACILCLPILLEHWKWNVNKCRKYFELCTRSRNEKIHICALKKDFVIDLMVWNLLDFCIFSGRKCSYYLKLLFLGYIFRSKSIKFISSSNTKLIHLSYNLCNDTAGSRVCHFLGTTLSTIQIISKLIILQATVWKQKNNLHFRCYFKIHSKIFFIRKIRFNAWQISPFDWKFILSRWIMFRAILLLRFGLNTHKEEF